MELRLPKGTKDTLPEEKILQDFIVSTIQNVFQKYGFLPLDTPTLEMFDILSSKYAGGEEILKETFKLKDQGNRELGLRYDLTVPLARFIAMNPQIKFPFKRYQIGKVFRDGPVSSNRVREFLQVDADIIGARTFLADAEIIALTSEIFDSLDIPVTIRINNRKILNAILQESNISDQSAILTIDKLDKIGLEGVKKELRQKGINEIEQLIRLIQIKDIDKLDSLLTDQEGTNELRNLLNYLKLFDIKNIQLDFSLARGLTYYTSTIFEVNTKKMKETIAGGGRYDNMIGMFMQKKQEIPAVGISFGISRIINLIKQEKKSLIDYYIIPINTLEKSITIASRLRKNGLKIDIDLNKRGISSNLDYANKLGIEKVIIIGEKELKQNKVKIKNMKTGKEDLVEVSKL